MNACRIRGGQTVFILKLILNTTNLGADKPCWIVIQAKVSPNFPLTANQRCQSASDSPTSVMPTLLFWPFLIRMDSRAAKGNMRSRFHGNCQPPVPPSWTPSFIAIAAARSLFPRGWGKRRRECETARVRERADKFCENTVMQYGRHCVQSNGGWSSHLWEEMESCDS